MAPATSGATASVPGSLPIRYLVVISQADAALTKMSFAWSAIIWRAATDRRPLSAIHQRKAWVSSNTRIATLLAFP